MAKLVLAGDASGQIELSAPPAAGANTITLPALTGELLTHNHPAITALESTINDLIARIETLEANAK